MSYFESEQTEEEHTQEHATLGPELSPRHPRPVGARLSGFRERITTALAGLDRDRLDQLTLDPMRAEGADELPGVADEQGPHSAYAADPADPQSDEYGDPGFELEYRASEDRQQTAPHRAQDDVPFPVSRVGYERTAVDAHLAELEDELAHLREATPAMSITEEIERLGEQTASILVVAHDQATETRRLAQEQADRCISDAASNAVAITEKAKRDLSEIDNETDGVWRERARLIEDARTVGAALIALADEAAERFPEDKPAALRSS